MGVNGEWSMVNVIDYSITVTSNVIVPTGEVAIPVLINPIVIVFALLTYE